jgi:hypothetical protein
MGSGPPDVGHADERRSRYTYHVQVHARSGLLRRWHGRVVMINPNGRRHHWQWRSARSREQLIALLWEETMRDIQWRTGGSSVEIIDEAAQAPATQSV